MTTYGIHTNAQGKSISDLIEVWQHVDHLGYGWISTSDHFPGAVAASSNESVTAHTALAMATSRAQCAVLCYSVGFRHPAVLASAAITIDHLSGGRAAIGLGSGSVPGDYEMYGFAHPPARVRTEMLEEATRCVTGLLRDDVVNFAGTFFTLTEARHEPRPLQRRLPIWLGVSGPRGLRIAAELADGWNTAFVPPEAYASKVNQLRRNCEELGRPVDEIKTSVNLMLLLGTDPSSLPEPRRAHALAGSVDQVVDRIGAYADAGADQINFFLPYPWDMDGLATLATALHLS